MDISEFRHEIDSIVDTTLAILGQTLKPYQDLPIDNGTWKQLMTAIYPVVENYREEAAEVGREFFDSERGFHVGGERHDVYLPPYELDWFLTDMRPARNGFIKSDATDGALVNVLTRATKAVEGGARKTIIRAVETDREAVGWARVATGRETCAFCLMLVSRGPDYNSARTAGLDLDDRSAQRVYEEYQATGNADVLKALMKRWHPNCDCIVVPVFDKADWPGYDAWQEAKQIWKDITAGYGGKDALNALRRAIDHGDVNPADIAEAA